MRGIPEAHGDALAGTRLGLFEQVTPLFELDPAPPRQAFARAEHGVAVRLILSSQMVTQPRKVYRSEEFGAETPDSRGPGRLPASSSGEESRLPASAELPEPRRAHPPPPMRLEEPGETPDPAGAHRRGINKAA